MAAEQQKIKVGVYGASGYAGQDAVEILSKHPCAEVVFATSSTYAGQDVPHSDLKYVPHDSVRPPTCKPSFWRCRTAFRRRWRRRRSTRARKSIDLSADFRMDTPESYAQWYGHEHPYPDMLPVPYGLPELNRDKLHNVDLVAAPGCYPTTTILGAYPLLKAGWLEPGRPIIVDAKSGVSGAGRDPKPNLHFVEVFGNFSPYNVGRVHRHVGEIEQEFHKLDPNAGTLIFTPHLLPVDRGLMASIYLELADGHTHCRGSGALRGHLRRMSRWSRCCRKVSWRRSSTSFAPTARRSAFRRRLTRSC